MYVTDPSQTLGVVVVHSYGVVLGGGGFGVVVVPQVETSVQAAVFIDEGGENKL